jgi:hypothetical protein
MIVPSGIKSVSSELVTLESGRVGAARITVETGEIVLSKAILMRIFIYQTGEVNGRLRANGILLIPESFDQWSRENHGKELKLTVVGSSTEFVLRITLVNSTDWVETDPKSIAKRDEFIRNAAIQHRMQLSQLRPELMFDVVSGQFCFPLPLMLSNQNDDEVRYFKSKFENHTNSIDDLPEVSTFVRKELADVEGDPLAFVAVKHLKVPTQLPIPSNTWLSCFVRSESKVWDGLYRLSGPEIEICVVGAHIQIGPKLQILSRMNPEYEIGLVETGEIYETESPIN